MKKYILLVVMMFAVLCANAQKIHWLLFIDTDDGNVGEIDKRGRVALKDHFVNVINAVLVQEGYEAVVSDNYGGLVNVRNCMNVINGLQCGPDDMVVFYYIGHGENNPLEPSQWPVMTMGNEILSLETVHSRLKNKNARLTITIGMCCNVIPNLVCNVSYGKNYGNTYLGGDAQETIKKLFLNNKGDILATSASVGESSGCHLTNGAPDMDTYTHTLLNNFETAMNNRATTWDSFFSKLGNDVERLSRNRDRYNCHQTPQFAASITQISRASRPRREEPEPVNPDNAVANVLNMIASNFDYVTDATSNDLGKRQNKSNEIAQYFSTNAKVKVYSQDGNYNVDSEPIDIYLRRMRTSGILMKVVPIDYRAAGGKITELKVKEYYKR